MGSMRQDFSRLYLSSCTLHPQALSQKHLQLYWMYTGGSVTEGVLSVDSFTFPTSSNRIKTFPNVVFGCGFENRDITFGGFISPENEIAGVFGLGAGRRSILMQLETTTQLCFSYCLPSWTGNYGTYTWLRAGPEAQLLGKLKDDGTEGFAIDSGVGPSFLVPEAYDILKGQVISYSRQYNWEPIKGEHTPYDVCYRITSIGRATTLPTMIIHFQGALMYF
ncbi:aspartic proteinase nepenthesin-1-like [Jatropha curcas]|uniref:aspartic proteinase nepenthesin-1-like n=1 Tax=Jatropha curcas TaxID=180498 RepID=UPI0005FB08E1|nr:aspartic proteinase nepenthesin-1-like [Jatropha curcas]